MTTNILGTVTSNYEFNGTTHYDTDDQKEGEEDLDVQERGEDFDQQSSLT